MVAGNKVKSLKSDIELSPETKSSRPSRVLPFALKKKKKSGQKTSTNPLQRRLC